MSDRGLAFIDTEIGKQQAVLRRTKAIWNRPVPKTAGRMKRTAAQQVALDQESEQRATAYREYQEAARALEMLRDRRIAYLNGEVYADGRPRKEKA